MTVICTSQLQLEPVHGDLHAVLLDQTPLRGVLDQDRVGVVEVDVDRALHGQRCELLEAAPGATDRQVSHLAGGAGAHAAPDQLVVGPAGPVEEQAGAAVELLTYTCPPPLPTRPGDQPPGPAPGGPAGAR